MVTAGTYNKIPYLNDPKKLEFFQVCMMEVLNRYDWEIQAWAILANHYHFIAISNDIPESLIDIIRKLHSKTAREVNRLDDVKERRIWYQYWDKCIRDEDSYHKRLNYVHHNPVIHGVIKDAKDYPFCSYSWFTSLDDEELKREVLSSRFDQVDIEDDF